MVGPPCAWHIYNVSRTTIVVVTKRILRKIRVYVPERRQRGACRLSVRHVNKHSCYTSGLR
jgi:hypothetical protein